MLAISLIVGIILVMIVTRFFGLRAHTLRLRNPYQGAPGTQQVVAFEPSAAALCKGTAPRRKAKWTGGRRRGGHDPVKALAQVNTTTQAVFVRMT